MKRRTRQKKVRGFRRIERRFMKLVLMQFYDEPREITLIGPDTDLSEFFK